MVPGFENAGASVCHSLFTAALGVEMPSGLRPIADKAIE